MTTDFRMVWESLTTCPGTCSGCNIAEKTDLENGLWTPQQFETASMHTKKLLKNGNHNNRQKLFLAAGDYLYLSEEKMKMVFDFVDKTLDKDAESRILLFTTSAIGKPEFIKEKVDLIQRLLVERNLDCFPEIVFDFAKIKHKKYWKTYIDNIQIINCAFPFSAINIQVGSDTFNNNMNQEKFQEFIKYCGVSRVEFVMSPHAGNADVIKSVWQEAIDFLKDTVAHLNSNNSSFIYPHTATIKNNLEIKQEKITLQEEVQFCLNNYQSNSFYIGFYGSLSHFYSGLSNIYPLIFANDDFLKKQEVNIFNKMYLSINKENMIKRSVIFNNKVSSANKCLTCKFQKNCHSMGNMILINNMKIEDKNYCPLKIYEYLEEIDNIKEVQQLEYETFKTINLNYKDDLNNVPKFTLAKDVD